MNGDNPEATSSGSEVPLTPAERLALDDQEVQQAHQRFHEGSGSAAPVEWLP